MRLTETDVEILKAVHDYRIIRGDQIQALFFGSQSASSYRLSRLYQHSYLDRHFLPTLSGLASSPTLYALAKRGIGVIRQERQAQRSLARFFWSTCSRLMMYVLLLRWRHNCMSTRLSKWLDDAELKADYDYVIIETRAGKKQQVSLIPDGYFSLQVP